jgi:HD-GYP domain-containing protein (c-di-GMP phosphodiesterase class II)
MNRSLPFSDVVASLSHALDLTEGQPKGHSIRSCVIGMEIADAIGLCSEDRSDLYYALLLKDAGCSVNAAPVAERFGSDDHPVKHAMKLTDWSNWFAAAGYALANAGVGKPLWRRLRYMVGLARGGDAMARDFTLLRCQRGAEIARQLGFSEDSAKAILHLDEHWDGNGHPFGVSGDRIPILARIACIAQTVDVFLEDAGVDGVMEVVAERRGTWFDPELADVVLSWSGRAAWWQGVRAGVSATALAGLEPEDRIRRVGESELDRVAEAYAEIIDAKSPFTYRHSRRVAEIARAIGTRAGASDRDVRRLYRAGLLHDVGKLGVSNRILDKPGALTDGEFEQIRAHPRHTLEILEHVDAFSDVAEMAAFHHERLDGRGYPWGLDGDRLDENCRILAVADIYEALTSDRPYRKAMAVEEVVDILRSDAGTAVDGSIVECLEGCIHEDGSIRPDDPVVTTSRAEQVA